MRNVLAPLAAAVAGIAFAQQGAAPATLERVTALMRDYARGVTENPFDAACRVSFFDPAGKLRKIKNTTYRLEFTKGRYRGVDSASESDWTGTIQLTHVDRRTLGLQLDSNIFAFLRPIFVFAPGGRNDWIFEPANPRGGNAITVSYRSREDCTFERGKRGFDLAHDKNCGSGEVTIDGNSAIPLRTSFEALGLPLCSGKETLKSCHVDAEFQNVPMTGSARPFVFPKRAAATWMFGDGKILIECSYTLHTGTK